MNFISRIIKSINAMRERLKIERHEAMYGPHFNEECALKAVSKMENEDGSRGEHWSLEETTSIANQYGINLKGEKYNKYDWYVYWCNRRIIGICSYFCQFQLGII